MNKVVRGVAIVTSGAACIYGGIELGVADGESSAARISKMEQGDLSCVNRDPLKDKVALAIISKYCVKQSEAKSLPEVKDTTEPRRNSYSQRAENAKSRSINGGIGTGLIAWGLLWGRVWATSEGRKQKREQEAAL